MGGICPICKKEKKILKLSRALGMKICDACRKEDCSRCGRFRVVAVRAQDGGALCNACFQRERHANTANHEHCKDCGLLRPVAVRIADERALCHTCYLKNNIGICKSCKRVRPIRAKERCGACYEKHRRVKAILSRNIMPYRAL